MADLLILTISSDNGPPFVCAASDIQQARNESVVHSSGRQNARTEVAHWSTDKRQWGRGEFNPIAYAYDDWALLRKFDL
jgi:hypothetical protein